MKKILSSILILLVLVFGTSVLADDKEKEKTVIIVLDQLDFENSKDIKGDNLSMGLLNLKTSGNNLESLFMTISTGRKVNITDNQFKSIVRKDDKTLIYGYDNIKKELDDSYPSFVKQISFLGEELKEQGIKTAFIGESNQSEILMIADKQGQVNYSEDDIEYSKDQLLHKAEDMLRISDCLLIAFEIDGKKDRVEVLASVLQELDDCNIIVFPKRVVGDVSSRLNNSLVPMLYRDIGFFRSGILTSKSTKRESVVTNLDLSPTILSFYNLDAATNIGNKIQVEASESEDLVKTTQDTLKEFLNLNLIKYVFHALATILSIYIAYIVITKKTELKKVRILLNTIIVAIMVSLFLGTFHLHRFALGYGVILLGVSFLVSFTLEKKKLRVIEIISIITNAFILIFAFINPRVLYESFIGYNSIVDGGRFYGFNNEIMGVLIVTSIIVYYEFKNRIKHDNISNIFLIVYFPIVIVSLSGGFGANFGGFLASISVFLILLYLSLFNRKINKKTIVSLVAIGILILVSNLYMDMKNDMGSHAGNLIERINLLGFYEFVDMIIKKVKQLIYMTLVPPWSIAFLTQVYVILFKFKEIKHLNRHIPIELIVMFISSLIVLLINDTGVVAFVYMNMYLISKIIEE